MTWDRARAAPHSRPNTGIQPTAENPLNAGTGQARKAEKPPKTPLNHAELHSQLTQRITELQRERQTYWGAANSERHQQVSDNRPN